MAGSNRSPAQRSGHVPQQWPPESEEQARAQDYERWKLQQQLAQQGYPAPPQGYAQTQDPAAYYPAQNSTYPQNGHAPVDLDHYHGQAPVQAAPPAVADPFAGRQPTNFAPHFERYAPPTGGQQPRTGGGYARAEPAPHAYAQEPQFHDPSAFGALPDPRSRHEAQHYDTQSQQHLPPAHQPAGYGNPDPRFPEPRAEMQSWDLSNYQPGQIPPGYPHQPGHHAGHPAPAAHSPQGWPPAPAQDQQWQDPHHQQWAQQPQQPQQHDPHAYQGFGQHQFEPGFEPQPQPGDDQHFEDDLGAIDPPRRGPSTMMIVGALVGAIIAGGGMAFAYKQFAGGGVAKARLAELKRPTTPEKVRPTDPGGRPIENTDKKFLNRLASDTPPEQSSDIDGPAKKVSTIPIVINREGAGAQSAQPAPAADSGVPGLVLDGFGPPPGGPPPPLRPSQPSPGQVAPPPTASRIPPPPSAPVTQARVAPPKVADLPLPKVMAQAKTPVPKKHAAARDDFAAPTGGAEATPSSLGATAKPHAKAAGGSGYVAVLASKKSRQDALNSFADLHSQYPDILGGMTPDVREANLGEKGLWYRLIVGPPGSREAAQSVCARLKDKGMKDCWPVSY